MLIARSPGAARGRQRPVRGETDHPGRRLHGGGQFNRSTPVWAAPIKGVGGMAQPLNKTSTVNSRVLQLGMYTCEKKTVQTASQDTEDTWLMLGRVTNGVSN